MKRFALLLTLLLSLIIKPVMANECCAPVHSEHSYIADHDHSAQSGDHEHMDTDSEGKVHDGSTHSHTSHNHSDYFRSSMMGDLITSVSDARQVAFWDDASYSDFSPGPLLEPPSRA